ncbi:MAG: prepilin peptidase [Desulfobacteraceae bacterium]|nr:prepilin peptidase [Desulfobacteraceae bacterium]
MSNLIFWFLVFFMGLCIGSFLNVCISRIPRELSIVRPGSRCPDCSTAIAFYDNIPVISWLLLKGRCRACGKTISLRYPLVELATGAMAVFVMLKYGISVSALIYFLLICALITISLIDLDHRIIPDSISLPGIAAGFLAAFLLPELSWLDSLIGILIGGGILYAVALGYYLFAGKEGMGGGDIKLLAMLGAFIGWKGVFFTIFAASLIGTAVGVAMMIASGKNLKFAVPFGPFLSAGAVIYLFFGQRIIQWYFYGPGPW